METMHDRIAGKLHEFINKIIFLEKKNVFNVEGLKLYPSEIHLILVMSEKPTNATQMAEKLHITTGAVSQTISRLVKKGVLEKTSDPYLKNELTLSFTPFGRRVFEKYKQMSEAMDSKFKKKMSSFNNKELLTIDRFLDHLIELPGPIDET